MPSKSEAEIAQENADLRARLEEAEETLRAIRSGEVDALVVGEEVYTLKGAETPYRVLIEQMYEGSATLADDGTVLYANRRLAALLRIPLQELIGALLRRFIAPAEMPAFDRRFAESKQCSSKAEFTLQCHDGSALPVQLSLSVVEGQGARPICAVVTDLTERKRAEVALRQAHDSLEQRVMERTADLQQQRLWLSVILTSIGDALIATDTAGRISFLNPVAETLTGWPQKDALGQPVQSVFRILDGTTRVPGDDIVARVLQEGAIVKLANNTVLLTRDGRETPIEDSAAPIRDGTGKVAGAVLVFHDVTAKRRAIEELRASNNELTRTNRLMVGRELRMVELKKEIDALCDQFGLPLRYDYPPRKEKL
jgi:PAS domain S-box-containing protein